MQKPTHNYQASLLALLQIDLPKQYNDTNKYPIMKKLIIVVLSCLLCLMAFGQEVDFSTYDKVITRGKVTIVCQNQEYRMIVGSLKKPRMALLLGDAPELAVGSLNRIVDFVKNQPEAESTETKVSFALCGELFVLSFSGPDSNRVASFSGTNTPARFSLSMKELKEMIEAIK